VAVVGLSNAELNITRLHELGYAIREEALSSQYTVYYEEKMEDGGQRYLDRVLPKA